MRAICNLEETILKSYPSLSESGCSFLSVPSLIRQIGSGNNDSLCEKLTEGDLTTTRYLLNECHGFYSENRFTALDCCKNESKAVCSQIPSSCWESGFACKAFQMMHFMMDKEFNPKVSPQSPKPMLKYVLSASETADASEDNLSHFIRKELAPGKVANEIVQVVSLYKKYQEGNVFLDSLLDDMHFFIIAVVCIVFVIMLYTRSVALTVCTLLEVGMTMVISFFIYRVCFGISFFPFLSVLAIPLLVGIGADDVFIFNDLWNQEVEISDSPSVNVEFDGDVESRELSLKSVPKDSERLRYRTPMKHTLKHAGLSIFVTSFTTGCSFFVNLISNVTVIKCFSLFIGICLIVNFLLMMLLIPAVLLMIQYCHQRFCATRISSSKLLLKLDCFMKMVNNAFIKGLTFMVTKGSIIWILLFASLGLGGAILTLWKELKPPSGVPQLLRDSHPLQRFKDVHHKEFDGLKDMFAQTSENLPVDIYFGIEKKDNGNYLIPDNKGTCDLTPSLNVMTPDSQKWIRSFCKEFQNQEFVNYEGNKKRKCVYDEILELSKRNCTLENHSTCCGNTNSDHMDDFDECFRVYWNDLDSIGRESVIERPMYGNVSAPPVAFQFGLMSQYKTSTEFKEMENFYSKVNNFSKNILDDSPAWFYSNLEYFDLQKSISEGAYQALGLAVVVAALVLLVSTCNFWIFFVSAITIGATVLTVVGVLVLLEWELNVLESLTITLAVGLSIDFVIHLGVTFKFLDDGTEWDVGVEQVLKQVGTAVTMAALTTFLSGLSLVGAQVNTIWQQGIFLMLVMSFSWMYSIFFFLPLLALVTQGVRRFWSWYSSYKFERSNSVTTNSVSSPRVILMTNCGASLTQFSPTNTKT